MATHTRYFRWDDPSAPTLSGTAGSLLDLLRACLVGTDGVAYGTGANEKLAAGWTEEFTGTNVAVFRNSLAAGGTGCYLRVDDTNAQHAIIQCYESMSDIDTGAGPAASAERYVPKSGNASSAARAWLLTADERTLYGGTHAQTATVPSPSGPPFTSSYGMSAFGAGDLDTYIVGDPSCFVFGVPTAAYTWIDSPVFGNAAALSNSVGGPWAAAAGGISLSREGGLIVSPVDAGIVSLRMTSDNIGNPSIAALGGGYHSEGLVTVPFPMPGYSSHVAITALVAGVGSLRGRLRGLFVPITAAAQNTILGTPVSVPGRPSGSLMTTLAGQVGTSSSTNGARVGRLFVETVLPWD